MTKPTMPAKPRTPFPSATWPVPLVMFETTSMVSTEYMILVFVAVLLLAVGLYTLNVFQKKKLLEEGELLERPSFIAKIFALSLDSRCRFDIFPTTGARLGQSLMGYMEELTATSLTINLGKAAPPPEVQSTPLICYFQLGTDKNSIFYAFTGTVAAHSVKDTGHCITLPMPKSLSNSQKRDFVRISPGPGMVEAVVAWKQAVSPEPQPLPSQGQLLGNPDFTYRPPKAAQVALVNISGGGVLLRLAGTRLVELQIRPTLGDRWFLLILLHDLETDHIRTMWLTALCRRIRHTRDTPNVDIGLQFTHWAQVDKPSQPIHWQPVQNEGEVPAILTWTLRVQSLLTRRA